MPPNRSKTRIDSRRQAAEKRRRAYEQRHRRANPRSLPVVIVRDDPLADAICKWCELSEALCRWLYGNHHDFAPATPGEEMTVRFTDPRLLDDATRMSVHHCGDGKCGFHPKTCAFINQGRYGDQIERRTR